MVVGANMQPVQSLRRQIQEGENQEPPTVLEMGQSSMQMAATHLAPMLEEAPIASETRISPSRTSPQPDGYDSDAPIRVRRALPSLRAVGGRRVRSISPQAPRRSASPPLAQRGRGRGGIGGRGGQSGRTPYDRPARAADGGMTEFSVTVGLTGGDIPHDVEARLNTFLADHCSRGANGGNLHWQGVIETNVPTSQLSLHLLLKLIVWGPGAAPREAHVRVTAITGRSELHTFTGMLGYCTKDSNEPHFREVRKNVSADLVARGKDIYMCSWVCWYATLQNLCSNGRRLSACLYLKAF